MENNRVFFNDSYKLASIIPFLGPQTRVTTECVHSTRILHIVVKNSLRSRSESSSQMFFHH